MKTSTPVLHSRRRLFYLLSTSATLVLTFNTVILLQASGHILGDDMKLSIVVIVSFALLATTSPLPARKMITYKALAGNRVPSCETNKKLCQPGGGGGGANPYTRGCGTIERCRRVATTVRSTRGLHASKWPF